MNDDIIKVASYIIIEDLQDRGYTYEEIQNYVKEMIIPNNEEQLAVYNYLKQVILCDNE